MCKLSCLALSWFLGPSAHPGHIHMNSPFVCAMARIGSPPQPSGWPNSVALASPDLSGRFLRPTVEEVEDDEEDDDVDCDDDEDESKVEGGNDNGSGFSGIVADRRFRRYFLVAVLRYSSQSSSPTPGILRASKSSCKACRIGGESAVILPCMRGSDPGRP